MLSGLFYVNYLDWFISSIRNVGLVLIATMFFIIIIFFFIYLFIFFLVNSCLKCKQRFTFTILRANSADDKLIKFLTEPSESRTALKPNKVIVSRTVLYSNRLKMILYSNHLLPEAVQYQNHLYPNHLIAETVLLPNRLNPETILYPNRIIFKPSYYRDNLMNEQSYISSLFIPTVL